MLKDKLFELRKKSGLSQEELSEKLNVSRQSISKWESGVSMPESEKLIAISDFFGVTIDYLMKDENARCSVSQKSESQNSINKENSKNTIFGYILLSLGVILLIVWGITTTLNSKVSEEIAGSSAVTLDGNGIALFFCVAVIFSGMVFLFKSKK